MFRITPDQFAIFFPCSVSWYTFRSRCSKHVISQLHPLIPFGSTTEGKLWSCLVASIADPTDVGEAGFPYNSVRRVYSDRFTVPTGETSLAYLDFTPVTIIPSPARCLSTPLFLLSGRFYIPMVD